MTDSDPGMISAPFRIHKTQVQRLRALVKQKKLRGELTNVTAEVHAALANHLKEAERKP